jgi:type IV conjugative transfer system protein TraL
MAVETRFPRWADSPPQFLIWEMDELIFPMAFFLIFLPMRSLLTGLVLGVISMRIYRRAKEKLPAFWYLHYLWVWGVWNPKGKKTPMPKGYISTFRE